MMRMKVRRGQPKGHRARRALLAAGFVGAAAEGIRRWRHRRQEHPEH
jgi:hypothetical protein